MGLRKPMITLSCRRRSCSEGSPAATRARKRLQQSGVENYTKFTPPHPMLALLALLQLVLALRADAQEDAGDPCDVFCRGPLLEAVQLADGGKGLFNDSKQFVDMPLKSAPAAVLQAFHALPGAPSPTAAVLRAFVAQHFAPAGSDLIAWTPPDWVASPPFLRRLPAGWIRDWGAAVHAIWRQLGRQPAPGAVEARGTLLHAAHPLVVPGGRFRESYYWDTYAST